MSDPTRTVPDVERAVRAVWRMESARLIGGLTRFVRDVGQAEDLAQDALMAALERWPRDGIPDNPGAWLMSTAKHRAIDRARHLRHAQDKHDTIQRDAVDTERRAPDLAKQLDDDVGDDQLRLLLIACHPVLSTDARVSLTLRLLGDLSTAEIARAFLVPEPTIAQRIVRAKKALADAGAAFEVPRGEELGARLASVLEVIYLIFNEGYAATAGDDWMRPTLVSDALRLGRALTGLAPDSAEAHGLVALMELQASRMRARVGPGGEPVLLLDQDRAKWDRLLIQHGLTALARSEALAPDRGPYALQAAIAACHARAPAAEATDWARISALYARLVEVMPSPIVELNRAVAVGMAFGPAAGLEIADGLQDVPQLASYHLLPSVRGELLQRLGRRAEARAAFLRAAELTQNTREQELLRARARACE